MLDWISRFEGLNSLDDHVQRKLTKQSRIIKVKKGERIFGAGKRPDDLLLLLEGTVRVQQVSDNGREIVLYRVQAGEGCVLTAACLLAQEEYAAEGIAETEVRAVAIPRMLFDDLLESSKMFRQFVFAAYSRRMTDLFVVIEELAFRRVDIRLAQKLIDLMDDSQQVKVTQQGLAAELGTAREVISRQLQEFQRRGWVSTSRGTVSVLDQGALADLAHNP